jgi:hypothetical protein
MIKGIIKWFKSMWSSTEVEIQNLHVGPRGTNSFTQIYLNDPVHPELMINEREPIKTALQMHSLGEMGSGYPLGSLQQQASALKIVVNNVLIFMSQRSGRNISNWAATQSLALMPRAGSDVNAYYDRGSLRFFFFEDNKKTIYSCDARPVVTHEFGHAFLDILRPDWWSVQAIEVWSFHEAFGDMTAVLHALQYEKLIDHAIEETKGDLTKSNVISRLGEQMGIGLYNITNGKNGIMPNCLRDVTHFFQYVEPEKLPSKGRDNELLSESHSFARVFTSAFWQIIVKIALQEVDNGENLRDALKISRDVFANYLLKAVQQVPTCTRLYNAIANQMILIDESSGGKYGKILNEVFGRHKIISQKILMLQNIEFDDFLKKNTDPYEIIDENDYKIIRTTSNQVFKLSEKLGDVKSLEDNPLFELEIEVPSQNSFYFLKNNLVKTLELDQNEIVDSAYACLKMLHENDLVGNNDNSLFEKINGKLVRKKIICKCGKPNYCDSNAPEYGKPWKPANNSGCTSCYNKDCKPQSCDCVEPAPPTPPKNGCYTSVKSGCRTTYRFGGTASRKVC